MSDYPPAPEPSGWSQQAPPVSGETARGNSGKAIAALVLGIIGVIPICAFFIICSILALIFGILSRNEINRSGGMLSGAGMSLAGIILGAVGIVEWIALIAVGVANHT